MNKTSFILKKQKAYVWVSVARELNETIDVTVSKTRDTKVYRKLSKKLELIGYKAEILCTDGNFSYKKYNLADRHVVTKA